MDLLSFLAAAWILQLLCMLFSNLGFIDLLMILPDLLVRKKTSKKIDGVSLVALLDHVVESKRLAEERKSNVRPLPHNNPLALTMISYRRLKRIVLSMGSSMPYTPLDPDPLPQNPQVTMTRISIRQGAQGNVARPARTRRQWRQVRSMV